MTLRFAPLVATLLLALSRLDASEAVLPQLTALSTRITEQESVFNGEARLAHKDVVLYADEVVYRNQERVAVARGNVLFIRGAQRLVTEEITYRLDDQTYVVGRFRVGQGELLAEGASAEGSPENLAVTDASLTYGEPDPLSPVLRARTITYVEAENNADSVAKLEGARLGIGSANIIPLPTLSQNPRNPAIAGMDARVGYSGNLGAEISVGATTSVSENLRLGGDVGLFSKRGVLFGPIGDYDSFGADGIGAEGSFRTGYIQDQGDTGLDIRGNPIRDDRGYVEWRHHQVFAPGLTLSGQVNYWSDSYVTRDFRPDGYYNTQTPDTWFEAAKVGDNFVVSLFTRVQANDYSVVKERLPEVRFDGLPVEVGGGFYHRINAGVAALKDDDPITGVTTRSDRADLYYGINRPISPREWLAFTPTAGARITHYERTNAGSDRGNYTRVLGEVGFDSKLWENSATWDYKNQRWGIDGLRHIVTPTVAYRFSPSADVGRGSIPAIDDDVFNTYLRPLGLADRREVDALPALNTFRFGVNNTLQTRDKSHGSRDLVQLQLAVDQHADAEA
ncbi:MAG: LPS assembly protein LptD, partial [Burkholderiales bacterium]|nr:LPS assembly protein LptD [Opitutaceae bacterium]